MKSLEIETSLPEQEKRAVESRIRRGVLDAMGSPRDLYGVKVVRLWNNCYRVNVLLGADITTTRISASYFITADDLGNILRSDPVMSK